MAFSLGNWFHVSATCLRAPSEDEPRIQWKFMSFHAFGITAVRTA